MAGLWLLDQVMEKSSIFYNFLLLFFCYFITLMSEYISASTRGEREEKKQRKLCVCVNACADEAEAKKSVQERNIKKHVFHDEEK